MFTFALFSSATLAQSSAWLPSKTVRVVVPASAGSAPDIFARIYASELQKALGRPVVVDNKPGASGIIGTENVAKADPDGSTILFGYNQLVTINPYLYPKLPFNVRRDLKPISIVLAGSYVLVANNDLPVRNLDDVIKLAKSKPGALNYGSSGNGSMMHLGTMLIEQATKIQLNHVPYKQAAINDLAAGHIQLLMEPAATAIPQIKAGKVRAIAVTGLKRLAALPDVPAISETLPNYDLAGWNAFWVPGNTENSIIQRYQQEINRINQMPIIKNRAIDLGYSPVSINSQEMIAKINKESDVWARLIKDNHIQLD
ncbi:Bug family tripartite tricarboxylate transporter substrate binding protein [Cupriavidus basilensis]